MSTIGTATAEPLGSSAPRRLERRLYLFLLVLGVVPLLIAGLIAYQRFKHHVRDEIAVTMRAMVEGARISVQEFLEHVRGRTIDIASDWYISDSLERPSVLSDLSRYLRIQRSLFPEAAEVFVINLAGRVVSSTNPDEIGGDWSDTEYFARALHGAVITDVTLDPSTGKTQWIVAAPVRSRYTGRLLGIVSNRIEPRALSDVTTGRRGVTGGASPISLRPGTTGEVYIVNSRGLMITESRFVPHAILAQRVDTEPVRRASRGEGMLGDYPDYRGVPITGASALISDMGWTVIAERDVSEAFAPLITLRLELLALGLTVIPAVIGLGFVLHRDIIRPMRRIIAADQRVLDAGAFKGLIPESSMPANEWARVMAVRNDMLRRLGQDQAWHEAEVGRQQRESQRLGDIVRAITAHEPLGRILQFVAEAARELCGAESAALQLDTAGLPSLPAVFTARAPDVRDEAASGERQVRARLIEPISIGDRRAGTLVVAKQGTAGFSDVDKAALARVARHAAVAIENARFHRGLIDAAERKDHFLATLAHELRNPLSPILHALQALDRVGARDAEAIRFRDIIRRQVRHVARLVSDLLDVSRIAAGKLRLDREGVDLRTIVRDAVEAMKHRDRAIETSVPAAAVVVYGDATRLDQIVRNLLDNAIKYSAPDTLISVHVWSEADDAFLVVQDNGIGIAPEEIPRVFDAYMQVDATLSHAHGGLGLGLSLVRGIVEAHGGAITLESDGIGKGTRVTIRLPLMA